jgi:hypothetical protein
MRQKELLYISSLRKSIISVMTGTKRNMKHQTENIAKAIIIAVTINSNINGLVI